MAQKSSSLPIVIGTFVTFGAIAAGAYFWEQHTHGPFSADKYVAKQLADAGSYATDAALYKLRADYVNQDGFIQAAFDDGKHWLRGGHLVMYFAAPSHQPAPKPRKPAPTLGAPNLDQTTAEPTGCPVLSLSAGLHGAMKQTRFGIESNWKREDTCPATVTTPLHCSVAQIWRRAIGAGAPHPAFATIRFYVDGAATPKGKWTFSIVDNTQHDNDKPIFERVFDDDCP